MGVKENNVVGKLTLPKLEYTPQSDFTYEEKDNVNLVITGYLGDAKEIRIPAKIDGKEVVEVNLEKHELTTIIMPDTVRNFSVNKAIKYINVPKDMQIIEENNLSQCKELVYVKLHDKLIDISSKAFKGCESLREITIPSDLTVIYDETFCDCISLEHVTFPSSMCYIEERVFKNCKSLKKINLHSGIREIGAEAFADCTSLESVKISYSDALIRRGAFKGCTALKEIILPKKLTDIFPETFYNCTSLESITLPTTLEFIENDAFHGCRALKSIEIPQKVSSIESKTFYRCTELKEVTLGRGVEEINELAFANCISLSKLTINGKLSDLEEDAFNYCGKLFRIYYKDKIYASPKKLVKEVNEKKKKKEIESLFIPKSQTVIKDSAYEDDVTLKTVQMSENVNEIGKNAFSGCTSLETVILSDNLKKLDDGVFAHCISLKNIDIPEGVRRIARKTFFDCENLSCITIPASVKRIASSALLECNLLEQIIIDDENERYVFKDGVLCDTRERGTLVKVCPNAILSVYELPYNISEVPGGAFKNCTNLTKIIFHEKVVRIGEDIFEGCDSLTSITYRGIEYPNVRYFEYGRKGYSMEQIEEIMAREAAEKEAIRAAQEAEEKARLEKQQAKDSKVDVFDEDWVEEAMNYPTPMEAFQFKLNEEGTGWIFKWFDKSEIPSFRKIKNVIIVPEEKDGLPITEVGRACFTSNDEVKKVILPDTITHIEKSAFNQCYGLQMIKMPKNLKTMGEEAFKATKIKSMRLPDGIKEIDDSMFNYCGGLKQIYIPDGIEKIEVETFRKLKTRITYKGVTYKKVDDFVEAFNKEKNE